MGCIAKIKDTSGTTHLVGSTLYGTCATAAATAEKAVTCADFDTLITGLTIHVKFTYSNSAANPKLNVNSTGAKTIYRYETTAPGTSAQTSWQANAIVSFTYDGTYWRMNDWLNNNDNTIPTAYCSTAANVHNKTASCTNYTLQSNSYIHVLMTNTNTVQGVLSLNINSKGEKTIFINGKTSGASNYNLKAGSYLVYYDGTNYHFRTDGQLPIGGLYSYGDIQVNTNKILFGDMSDSAGIYREDNTIKIFDQSSYLYIAQNGTISLSAGGTGHDINIGASDNINIVGNTSITGTLTSSSTLTCSGIVVHPGTSQGTISYDNGMVLQYQGSKITMTNSALKLYSTSWLTGTGTAAVIPTSGTNANVIIKSSSSRRYKMNIDYEVDREQLHKDLMKFKPCTFNYKTEPDLNQYGFIAEDIEEINPKLCLYQDNQVENYLDRGVLTLIICELQRKDKEIQELRDEINQLKKSLS